MNQVASHYQTLTERFVRWAAGESEIRAVVQVGSRARSDRPADEWSDVDVIIAANTPDRHLADATWCAQIAPVWLSIASRTAGNDPERLVLFEGGYAMDFVWVPAESLQRAADAGIVPDGFRRGCRVLLDKDQIAARLVPEDFGRPEQRLPPPHEYEAACDSFWYVAVYIAKQIRRGDPWLVKVRDSNLKEVLLRMIEWHSLSHGAADVWHMGRFMDSWADPRALGDVPATFGHYDLADSSTALLRATALFDWLARETAERGGFDYQSDRYDAVRAYVERLLADG
jgi:aminoglycoside 6-adenylyltransferase